MSSIKHLSFHIFIIAVGPEKSLREQRKDVMNQHNPSSQDLTLYITELVWDPHCN